MNFIPLCGEEDLSNDLHGARSGYVFCAEQSRSHCRETRKERGQPLCVLKTATAQTCMATTELPLHAKDIITTNWSHTDNIRHTQIALRTGRLCSRYKFAQHKHAGSVSPYRAPPRALNFPTVLSLPLLFPFCVPLRRYCCFKALTFGPCASHTAAAAVEPVVVTKPSAMCLSGKNVCHSVGHKTSLSWKFTAVVNVSVLKRGSVCFASCKNPGFNTKVSAVLFLTDSSKCTGLWCFS